MDQLGGLEAAARLAGELGGIEGEPALLYPEKKFRSMLDLFLGEKVGSLVNRARLPSFHLSYLFVAPTP